MNLNLNIYILRLMIILDYRILIIKITKNLLVSKYNSIIENKKKD